MARPDDDASAGAQPVGHAAEVQVVAGAEDLVRAKDHGGQPVLGDHALDGHVRRRLGYRIRIAERLERERLVGHPPNPYAIHAG